MNIPVVDKEEVESGLHRLFYNPNTRLIYSSRDTSYTGSNPNLIAYGTQDPSGQTYPPGTINDQTLIPGALYVNTQVRSTWLFTGEWIRLTKIEKLFDTQDVVFDGRTTVPYNKPIDCSITLTNNHDVSLNDVNIEIFFEYGTGLFPDASLFKEGPLNNGQTTISGILKPLGSKESITIPYDHTQTVQMGGGINLAHNITMQCDGYFEATRRRILKSETPPMG